MRFADAHSRGQTRVQMQGESVASSEAATREVSPASSAEQSPSAQAQQHRQSASAPLTCGSVAGAKRPRFSVEKHSEPPMRTLLFTDNAAPTPAFSKCFEASCCIVRFSVPVSTASTELPPRSERQTSPDGSLHTSPCLQRLTVTGIRGQTDNTH